MTQISKNDYLIFLKEFHCPQVNTAPSQLDSGSIYVAYMVQILLLAHHGWIPQHSSWGAGSKHDDQTGNVDRPHITSQKGTDGRTAYQV